MKAQKDANFPSDLSARALTSFQTVLPSALIGLGAVKSDDEEASFNLVSCLKNHDVWHVPDGLSGRSQRILKGLPSISKRVSFLANITTARADVLRLSQGMVSTSIAFLQSLITFMSTWHLEMVTASPFTDVEVWQFCVHILETIFEKLRTTRGVIQDAAEDDPSLLIWGMLKAHEVMARLEANGFRNDPLIPGRMMRMLMTHGPHTSLQTNVHKMEGQVESNKATCGNLKMRVMTLEKEKK
jgi:hypothetical protein